MVLRLFIKDAGTFLYKILIKTQFAIIADKYLYQHRF